MNTHKNARLTFARRVEMIQDITIRGMSVSAAAEAHGVTPPTARKWLGRYLALGEAGLVDASSRPDNSPRAIEPGKALAIVELRHRRLTQARIAAALSVSKSTVSRVLARAGLSRLADLQPVEPVVRYEHEAPGDMLHIDTKKLGFSARLLRGLAGADQAAAHGQRLSLPVQGLCPGLQGVGHPPQVHPTLSAADQRQGREVHPVSPAGVGLWLHLPELQ